MTVTLFEEPATATSPFDAYRHEDGQGEYWTGRELCELFAYSTWQQFSRAAERAIMAIDNSTGIGAGQEHISTYTNMVEIGNGATRVTGDYRLTRYGAYMVAMNGDPRKPEIAAAQTYFAVKTREAETRTGLGEIDVRNPAHISELARITESLAKRVLELEPDATAWKVLASAEGDYSVREAAYILNRDKGIETGEKRLFETIRDRQMVDYYDRPYAQFNSHLTLRPYGRKDWVRDDTESLYHQLRVTAQGLKYLHRVLGGTDKTILDEYVR